MRRDIPRQIARQITGERRLGGRRYFLLERLGTHGMHHKAFFPQAGSSGGFRVFHEFDRRSTKLQHIDVLDRLGKESNGSFPAILERDKDRESVYVVTDWTRGHTLQQHIAGARRACNEGPKKISVGEAVKLFRWFADDLCRLHHKRNLVHGDLTPKNIIVRRNPNRLVMIDFGSAWQVERTGARDAGDGDDLDYHYTAPEKQRPGAFVDFRADIFSASVIFFEMLTLKMCYGGSGGKVARLPPEYAETYEPPSKLADKQELLTKAAWASIDRVVTTGLQLDPAKRYQSGSAWLRDVHAMREQLNQSAATGPIQWLRRRFG